MQYEVQPTYQNREIDPKLKGSFKNFSHLIQKSIKNQPDFSRTCGFRGDFRKSLNFHFKPLKKSTVGLDFRQNPLKVEKWPFLAYYHKILNDPDFSRTCHLVRFLPLLC